MKTLTVHDPSNNETVTFNTGHAKAFREKPVWEHRRVPHGHESGTAMDSCWVGLYLTQLGDWVLHEDYPSQGRTRSTFITDLQAVAWLTRNGYHDVVERIVGPIPGA